ncbi:MAG: glycosyltransferase family 2 protein, partial [Deltaproteobacteria bacterium]|nr:glycosyltransferase family 2 protein [Deltaproteobacteria bacterium]
RVLRPLWRELFRRQEAFNREALATLEQYTGRARAPVTPGPTYDYDAYIRAVEKPFAEQVIRRARTLPARPLFSVITPVHDTPAQLLQSAVESVLTQAWDRWELVLVNDGSTQPHVRPLLDRLARRDRRIRVVHLPRNGGIARATNAGLSQARGSYVAFLDHDDTLNQHALAAVACALADHPGTDVVYSDEDRPDVEGRRQRPYFKPDFSPDLLRSVNYVCHLLVVRRELLESLGGLRTGLDGAQDHDLVLRLSERTAAIRHVPSVLYHWRYRPGSASGSADAYDLASRAGQRAVQAHLERTGVRATVDRTPVGYRVKYPVQGEPLVSLVVPFKDRPELLAQLWRSLQQTRYDRFELLLVSNQSRRPETRELLDGLEDPRIRKLSWDHPFNYSAINNFGARQARGELLVFLNNDIEAVDPDWLGELVSQAQRPEVGAVGPLLLFPDGALQHAGVVLGLHGFAGHPFWRMRDQAEMTPFGHAYWARNCLAVTGACLAVRRELFEAVGGFDERFEVCGSDVELCLRLGSGGRRVLFTPHARLVHHESASRRLHAVPERDHWRSFVAYRPWLQTGDPFYNPNLTLSRTDCAPRLEGGTGEDLALSTLRGLLPDGAARGALRRAAHQRHLVAHLGAFQAPAASPPRALPARIRTVRLVLSGNDAHAPELDVLSLLADGLVTRGVTVDWAVQGATPAQWNAWQRRLAQLPARVNGDASLAALGPVDLLVATSWETAFPVAAAASKGGGAYWVRDDESLAYPSGSLSGLARAA